MELPYDKLMNVLDAYIDEFDGGMRIRGIRTLLALRRATLKSTGLSVSEARRSTGAPQENLRRYFGRHADKGNLIAAPDANDDRVTRYRVTNLEAHMKSTRRIAERLNAIGRLDGELVSGSRLLGIATLDSLDEVLQALSDSMDGSIRIRGFKIAIVIQQATLAGRGITTAEIARASGAALETSRRSVIDQINRVDWRAFNLNA